METTSFTEKMKAFTGFDAIQNKSSEKSEIQTESKIDLKGFERNGIKIEFVPSNRKKTKKVNISIEGDFTLKNTTEAVHAIVPVFEQFDLVSIMLKNISSIDLAAIQCLFKIKCIQEAFGKTVCLESELPKEYKDLIYVSGLLPLVNNSKLMA